MPTPPLPPRPSPTGGLLSPPTASPSATSPFSSSPLASSPLRSSPLTASPVVSSSSPSLSRSSSASAYSSADTLTFPASTHPSIRRFHTYLNTVYTPHELAARLSSRTPARSDDVHVLHCAAAHANLWVVLDRGFQVCIRQRGVDFCTLTAAVHVILSNLPPYEFIDASPDEEDAQPALASVPDNASGGAGVPAFVDPRPGVRGQVFAALERTTRSSGKRSSQFMHRLGGRVGEALSLKDRPPANVPSLSSPAGSTWRVSVVHEKRLPPPPFAYDAPAGPIRPVLPPRPSATPAASATSTPPGPSPAISISPPEPSPPISIMAAASAGRAGPAAPPHLVRPPLPARRQTAPTPTLAIPKPSPGLGTSISDRFRAMSGTPYTDSLPSPGLSSPGPRASRSPFSFSPGRKPSPSSSPRKPSPSSASSGTRKSSPAKPPPAPVRPKPARTNTAPTPGRLSVPHLSVPHVSLKTFKLGARRNGQEDSPPALPPRPPRSPQRM